MVLAPATGLPGGVVQTNDSLGGFSGDQGFTYGGFGDVYVGFIGVNGGTLHMQAQAGGEVEITPPVGLTGTTHFVLPPNDGTVNYVLRTDGSGVTTWVPQTGGTPTLAGENYLTIAGSVITAHPVDLGTSNVTGNLGTSHLNSGVSASGATFWRGDGVWASGPTGSGVARPSLSADTTFYCRKTIGTATISSATPAVVTCASHGLSIGDAVVFSLPLDRQAITTTVASPTVVTQGRVPGTPTPTAHGFAVNDPIVFYSNGAIATGITEGTTYYVKTVPTASTFTFSATVGGAAINITVAQSGNCSVERQSALNSNIVDAAGRSDGGIFYVIAAGYGSGAFQFATTVGGSAINTSSGAATTGRVSLATGNDANTGLSLAQAFLTLQGAWATVPSYDFHGHTITIQMALNCTYTSDDLAGGGSVLEVSFLGETWIGGGQLIIQGDATDAWSGGIPPNGGNRGTLSYAQDRVRLVGSNIILSFSGPFPGAILVAAMRQTQKNSINPAGTAYGINANNCPGGGVFSQSISYNQQNGGWTSMHFMNGSVSGSGGYDQIINTDVVAGYFVAGSSEAGSSAAIDIYGGVGFNTSFWDMAESTFLRSGCDWVGKLPDFSAVISFNLLFQRLCSCGR